MILEHGSRQGTYTPPQPTETNTDDHKPVHDINDTFDGILNLAFNPDNPDPSRDLQQQSGLIRPRHFNNIIPGRDVSEYFRVTRMEDGIWMRTSSSSQLAQVVHTLILFTDGSEHEFHEMGLGKHSANDVLQRDFVGAEHIADAADLFRIAKVLGRIETLMHAQRHKHRWNQQLSPGDLKYALLPPVDQ